MRTTGFHYCTCCILLIFGPSAEWIFAALCRCLATELPRGLLQDGRCSNCNIFSLKYIVLTFIGFCCQGVSAPRWLSPAILLMTFATTLTSNL